MKLFLASLLICNYVGVLLSPTRCECESVYFVTPTDAPHNTSFCQPNAQSCISINDITNLKGIDLTLVLLPGTHAINTQQNVLHYNKSLNLMSLHAYCEWLSQSNQSAEFCYKHSEATDAEAIIAPVILCTEPFSSIQFCNNATIVIRHLKIINCNRVIFNVCTDVGLSNIFFDNSTVLFMNTMGLSNISTMIIQGDSSVIVLYYNFSIAERGSTTQLYFSNCLFANTNQGFIVVQFDGQHQNEREFGETGVFFRNCTFGDNTTTKYSSKHEMDYPIQISTYSKGSHFWFHYVYFEDVIVRNVICLPGARQYTAALRIQGSKNVLFRNCSFVNNFCTGMSAGNGGAFTLSGNIIFENNTGYQGGGIALFDNSFFSVESNTTIVFRTNQAMHVGGAIFVWQECTLLTYAKCSECFIRLPIPSSSDLNMSYINYQAPNIKLIFENNTSVDGGDAIYGAALYWCEYINANALLTINIESNNNHYHITQPLGINSNYSGAAYILPALDLLNQSPMENAISSTPSRVCLCENNRPNCSIVHQVQYLQPGRNFTLSVVTVGDAMGPSKGIIYAQFQRESAGRFIYPTQAIQLTSGYECNQISYYIALGEEDEIMIMNTRLHSTVNDHLNTESDLLEKSLLSYNHKLFPNSPLHDFLSLSVYIDIKRQPCSPGFKPYYGGQQSAVCSCDYNLNNKAIECDENTNTVLRSGQTWIGVWYHSNDSNQTGYVVGLNSCDPFYCISTEQWVDLLEPDVQCIGNRSGIICGRCALNYSSILGSYDCQICTNDSLLLLFPFALLGVLVITFMWLLNLTVTAGTINGLIFYANITNLVSTSLFPENNSNILKIFVAWASLDFGIKTCFYNGLTMFGVICLEYCYPIYLWLLAALAAVVSHCSTQVTRHIRKNPIPVIATLLILPFMKLLRAASYSLQPSIVTYYPGGNTEVLWTLDGSSFSSYERIPLIIVALLVICFLTLITILLLFPAQLQKYSSKKVLFWVHGMKPIIDAFRGPLKDQRSYWIGFHLAVRGLILFITVFLTDVYLTPDVVHLLIAIGSTLLLYGVSMGGIYKNRLHSFLESAYLLNLIVLSGGTFYIKMVRGNQIPLTSIMVGIAFVQFWMTVAYHVYQAINWGEHFTVFRLGKKLINYCVTRCKRNVVRLNRRGNRQGIHGDIGESVRRAENYTHQSWNFEMREPQNNRQSVEQWPSDSLRESLLEFVSVESEL